MTQATNLEGLTQKNSADIERAVRGWHVAPPERTSRVSYITFRDGQQQRRRKKWSNGSPNTPVLHYSISVLAKEKANFFPDASAQPFFCLEPDAQKPVPRKPSEGCRGADPLVVELEVEIGRAHV